VVNAFFAQDAPAEVAAEYETFKQKADEYVATLRNQGDNRNE